MPIYRILLLAAAVATESWTLPQGLSVKDEGPRTYRFVVDYTSSDTRGQIVHRQRLSGDYTRGLPGGDVRWTNVSNAEADGATTPLPEGQKREYMEGLRYRKNLADVSGSMKPDFFKNFPPAAVQERNLVWDSEMIELFGQAEFEHLRLNEPYHLAPEQDVKMPGIGTFQNRDVQLTWTGRSRRNGQDCAVIGYTAFFNRLDVATPGMTLVGRSHYWGQIWVSLTTKQIEYATLFEDVLGELKFAGQDKAQIIDVFRSGVFEPISSR